MGEVMAALDRRAAVARLLSNRADDLLVVTGLGSPAYDVMAMGSAAMVGLGLAKAQPKKSVLVVTGDGDLMMGLGALATIATQKPGNLTICVLDNGHFGETGMQASHAGMGVALDKVAASIGFGWTADIADMAGIDDLRARLSARDGARLARVRIKAENPPRVLPPRDGVHIKNRFRAALGFSTI
jgi:thiamine pyrophosphate-dependent acetolactate synthase large subunit-like protein